MESDRCLLFIKGANAKHSSNAPRHLTDLKKKKKMDLQTPHVRAALHNTARLIPRRVYGNLHRDTRERRAGIGCQALALS